MTKRESQLQAFGELLDIMDELREKCPWDKKQTMNSLRHLTIEETYELGDAILDNDLPEIRKELGDLLLHIVFYAKIGSESNDFDIQDVINGINEKLISRHPHVFGDVVAETEEQVAKNWEQLKLQEGKKNLILVDLSRKRTIKKYFTFLLGYILRIYKMIFHNICY